MLKLPAMGATRLLANRTAILQDARFAGKYPAEPVVRPDTLESYILCRNEPEYRRFLKLPTLYFSDTDEALHRRHLSQM